MSSVMELVCAVTIEVMVGMIAWMMVVIICWVSMEGVGGCAVCIASTLDDAKSFSMSVNRVVNVNMVSFN